MQNQHFFDKVQIYKDGIAQDESGVDFVVWLEDIKTVAGNVCTDCKDHNEPFYADLRYRCWNVVVSVGNLIDFLKAVKVQND